MSRSHDSMKTTSVYMEMVYNLKTTTVRESERENSLVYYSNGQQNKQVQEEPWLWALSLRLFSVPLKDLSTPKHDETGDQTNNVWDQKTTRWPKVSS